MTYCHERNPAIELYRILLMLGIVALHVLQAAGLGFSPMARWVEFCVDGFVFISGWYGIRFGWRKVVKIYGLALWCSALYLLAKWICFVESPWSTVAFVKDVVKHAGWYWFVNAYVVLMCLAPIVNAALESRKSRALFVPLLIAVFGWSFACMVPGLKAWMPHPTGFGSHTFLTLLGVYVVARIACLDKWDEAVRVISPSMLAVYLLHGCGADFVFVKLLLSQFANPYLAVIVTVSTVFVACVAIDFLRRFVLKGTCRWTQLRVGSRAIR